MAVTVKVSVFVCVLLCCGYWLYIRYSLTLFATESASIHKQTGRTHRSTSRSPPTQPLHTIHQQKHQQQQQQHNIHIISFDKRGPHAHVTGSQPINTSSIEQPNAIAPGDNYSYVQLTSAVGNEFKMPATATTTGSSGSPITSTSTVGGGSMATVMAVSGDSGTGCGAASAAAAAGHHHDSGDGTSRIVQRRDSIGTLKKCNSGGGGDSSSGSGIVGGHHHHHHHMGELCDVMDSVDKDMQKIKMRRRCR